MKKMLSMAISIALITVLFLTGTVQAQTTFWTGSVPVIATESLVVKIGTTVLENGRTFQAVNMKVGDVHTKTFTIQNTGAVSYLVKPVVLSPSPDVTAVFNNIAGLSIASGATADFVLTITAVNANAGVSIPVSFTRE